MTNNVLLEYLGKNGAGIYFTLEMTKAFLNNNKKVYILLSSKIINRAIWEQLEQEKDDLTILFIDTGNKKTIVYKTIVFLIKKGGILDEFKDIDFDYAIRTFPHPWMEFIEKELKIKKVAFILHDPIPHTGTQWYRRVIAKRNVKTATDIIVLSRKFIDVVCDNYKIKKNNIHFMRHGILSASKIDGDYETDIIEINDVINKKTNFLFFGRIDKYKGLAVLAKAYQDIEQEFNDKTTLIIAGNGDFSEYKELYNKLKSVYIYNRYITDYEIDRLFSLPNVIVVLPYIDATQSGVIAVAADYLCPVIASDTGGLKEQLDDGKIGIFFEKENSIQLADAMKLFVVDKKTYNSEKQKMLGFREKLEWNNIIKELIDSLENI